MYGTEFEGIESCIGLVLASKFGVIVDAHLRAQEGDIMIVDEPETYLHPKVQKQLLDIVRNTGAQVFMALTATLRASASQGEVLGLVETQREQRYKEMGVPL